MARFFKTQAVAIITLVFVGIQVWDVLDKRGLMSGIWAVAAWVASSIMVTYSVWRNIRAAKRWERSKRDLDERSQIVSRLQSEMAHQAEEYKADIGECRRELSREKTHRLSWRKAGQVETLLNEARCLDSDLDHMLTVARIPGNMHAVLEHPLAKVAIEEYGCQGFPIEVWRFQKQFYSHRDRCVNLGISGEDISPVFARQWNKESPEWKADTVLNILRQHYESLLKYSDKVTNY